jgi:hypothetical protein
VAGVAPLTALTAPAAPNRAVETDTLNFELPAATLDQLTATTNLDVRVDVTPVVGETNAANNSGEANDLDVVGAVAPKIFFTRINYTPAGLGLPSDALIAPGVGDAMLKGILPVNDRDPGLYTQGLFPSLTFSGDANSNNILNVFDTEGNDLINLLEECRQLIVSNGLGATETTFLYGWLKDNPIDNNGLGAVGGNIAFGNTAAERFQRTYAHEFTHNLGFNHPPVDVPIDEVGWDVGARLPGSPAGNNTVGRVKPTTLFDIQVPGLVTNQAWIETSKYISSLGDASLGFGADSDSAGDIRKKLRRSVMSIQGRLDRSGRRLLSIDPVFRYPWLSQPTPSNASGNYIAEVVTATGGVIRAPFDGGLGDDAGENDVFGTFAVQVAAPRDVRLVRIRDRRTRRILGSNRRGGSRSPRISIVAPRFKARLGKRTRVRYRAVDPDTARASLRFQAAYSPDNGRSFVPIAVGLRGSSFVFDSTQIPRSRGAGVIRVFVSDGLNTSYADVRGLTTTAAR